MNLESDLANLGGDKGEIATTLKRKGVKGFRCEHGRCPIAQYLHGLHPDHKFEVTQTRIQIDGEGRIITPGAVGRFVTAFDLGEYPDLEA